MEKGMNRRQFLTVGGAFVGMAAVAGLAGCSSSGSSSASAAASSAASGSASASAASGKSAVAAPEKIVFAWEPGASEGKYENMRDVFAEAIAAGAGIPCEPMTTPDYNVCIEAVNSGQAPMASLGAQEYVELHKKNPAVEVAFVLSDKDGKLNQVSYHSQVLVSEENAAKYKNAKGEYELNEELMKGTNIAYVNQSSTSGCIIPSTVMSTEFGVANVDDMREPGKFFNNVIFGGSHVLAMYQVLTGDADVCTVDDTGAANNYKVVEGENGVVGSVYEIKADLEAPMDEFAGKRLVVIASYPVPAVPFVVNTDYVPADMVKNIVDYMCSSAVSDNPELFKDPKDEDTVTKWKKSSDKIGFVPADDSYYDEFRKLIGEV